MTIDTSREAVELRLTRLRAAYEEFRAPYGHIAALITQAKLTETMMDVLLAERDAALAEVARLSTALAETEALEEQHSAVIERLQAEITRLSQAIAAETAKREAMGEALAPFAKAGELFDGTKKDPTWTAVLYNPAAGKEYQITECHVREARATLAKHGSKT